jgi:4-diphosphocytidyl-2-C-methyl-D-erythritol kinase
VSGELRVAAPAKLNLFLHVGEKRADGYHDLESLVAFTSCGDEIRLQPDSSISLSIDGPFGTDLPRGEENLALHAARLLAERTGARSGARILLYKDLPVSSGIGGGSADAAGVLRGLVHLWTLEVTRETLRDIGAFLGADVPVCLDSVTSWMGGRGERVRALPPLPHAGILLVNPGVPVPTGRVFAALRARHGLGMPFPEQPFADVHALVRFLNETANDLEAPARVMAPAIGEVLRAIGELPGVLLARMSGSGATCFGLFSDEERTRTAGPLLRARHPDWWIAETTFVDGRLLAESNESQ